MDENRMPSKKGQRQSSRQFSLRELLLTQILEILDEAGTEFSEERMQIASLNERLAYKRFASDILSTALMRLQLLLNSMQMPLPQLDSCLQTLKTRIRGIEQQKVAAGDLLAGDRKRLANYIEEQAARLSKEARAHLLVIVEDYMMHYGDNLKEDLLVKKLIAEIHVFFDAKLKIEADAFNQRVMEVLGDHQKRADALIETLNRTAYELFDVTYQASKSSEAYKMRKEPFLFKTLDTKLSPIPKTMVGSVLPAKMQRSMTRKIYTEKIEKLVINNVENLRWSALQNLDHLFRTFGTILDEGLQATVFSTLSALQAVRDKRSDHISSLSLEITRLQDIKVKLEKIKKKCDTI